MLFLLIDYTLNLCLILRTSFVLFNLLTIIILFFKLWYYLLIIILNSKYYLTILKYKIITLNHIYINYFLHKNLKPYPILYNIFNALFTYLPFIIVQFT